MSPIEKGARALALSQSGVDEWDALDEAFQENLKEHVRAVLEALREPSEGMVDAAHLAIGRNQGPASHFDCRIGFIAMVDVALSE